MGKVFKQNIAEAAKEYTQLFAANKNLYRAVCCFQDGLKPGRRRIYYSWWLKEGRPQNTRYETLKRLKFIKSAIIVSNTMAFHPHGDTANVEILAREGQYWNNNISAIETQGSFGNLRGDEAASFRYSEVKMAEYMIDCFFDSFDKYCVPMKTTFDGSTVEPEFLPAKYPHVLFNPNFSSIGTGMASNIPPFNIAEVLQTTIDLIKDPNAKVLLIPDSPTGADVVDTGTFKEINDVGISKVTFRATSKIDYQKNEIRFTSIPLQMSTDKIVENILAIKKAKKDFEDIIDIQDNTKEGEVDLTIVLSRNANPDKVLKNLYKRNTGLKMGYSVGITVIDDYEAYEYSIKELLLKWIEFRRDIVLSMFNYDLQITEERIHVLTALLDIISTMKSEEVFKLAKSSKDRRDNITKIMKKYNLTSIQAASIVDLRMYQFNEDSYKRYKTEVNELNERLEVINKALSDDGEIDKFIINQLEEGIRKWGRPRMSKIVKEDGKKKNVPNTEHLIGISESGFIKKLNLEKDISIGMVGKENGNLTVMQINNREDILVIDDNGRVSRIAVSAIPDMKFKDIGVELCRYFTTEGRIVSVMKLPSDKMLKKVDDNVSIIFITKNGLAKRTPLSEFAKISDYKSGITLNFGDKLVSTVFAFDETTKDVVIATNFGDGIRLPIQDIRVGSRNAKGSRVITLKDDEEVVSMSRINPDKDLLLYVTSSGKLKLTEMEYFPSMNKKDSALSLIKLEGKDKLIGITSVSHDQTVIVYRKHSEPVTIDLSEVPITTRVAKGTKMVKVPKGDFVVAYKVF